MARPHILAFYLPQFRPIKENNDWFGEGFTEWTNVAKAKPLFKGHLQPKIPADLGFYDLRLTAVREKQAELARESGVSAFCYYHYWFGEGKKILHETLEEVVAENNPDFPFCICWANHSWYKKNWNPDTQSLEQNLLLEQRYPGIEDIIEHFNYLLPMFRDNRYYKIDGRLVFSIYDFKNFKNFNEFKRIWNKMAIDNGLPEFYFLGYTANVEDTKTKLFDNTDGVILSLVTGITNRKKYTRWVAIKNYFKSKLSNWLNYPIQLYKYKEAMSFMLDDVERNDNIIPVIVPNWDYTPRRGAGGLILRDSTPDLFKEHVKQALDIIKNKPAEKQIIFLKSWNEWGEGNYMEPDLVFGKGYINALKEAINEFK